MNIINQLKRFVVLSLVAMLSVTLFACQSLPITTTEVLPTPESVGNFSSYDELKTYLSTYYEESNNNLFLYRNGDINFADSALEGSVVTTTATASYNSDSDQQKTYSETNNQVEGVYESDTILTDGVYIYVTSNSHFYIVDSETLAIVFTYSYENAYLIGMYLYNDKVVVLSSEYSYEETTDSEKTDYYYWYRYSYGIRANVFDVSDIDNVEIMKSLYFDSASIVDTRMIDGTVYMVLDNYAIYYGYSGDDFVPEYLDSVLGDSTISLPAENIYYMPNDNQSFGYLLLISFSVNNNEAANVKAYLGSSYQIYMSHNNLYTIIYRSNYDSETNQYSQDTFILRFQISNEELVYQAIGKVEGMPIDQFAMDEYEGVFRIATTGYNYNWNDQTNSTTNTMFLLDATTVNQMTEISRLEDLGKANERIYSVRYSDDYAYLVTFVNTDPLYKLDLSNPSLPFVAGFLEEDGVSDYLHEIIKDQLMIGIGRQAETVGTWTHFTGVKVALYDTTGASPAMIETYFVEGEYSYSPVVYDHKAFVSYTPVDSDFTYVVIPVYEYSDLWFHSSQSAYVFKVYFTGDLEFVTKLTHMDENSENPYYYYFDSIERTVMIGDRIYTVSYTKIQMYDMNDNFTLLASTQLEADYYYYMYGISVVD